MAVTHEATIVLSKESPARERIAAIAFLAGYKTRTRISYELDLRLWFEFCGQYDIDPMEAKRPHIEMFGRLMEQSGKAVATVARRLSTICVFYSYMEAEEYIAKNPGRHVRRPKVSQESTTLGLDRNEMGALIYVAERGRPAEFALVTLLALNGLRVSEACNAEITAVGLQRGHKVINIIGKGDKPAVIPLAPRTARAVDLAIGERHSGKILLDTRGEPMARHSAAWIIEKLARRVNIPGHITPLRTAYAMPSSQPP